MATFLNKLAWCTLWLPALGQSGPRIEFSEEAARQRGPQIFNAVHDAMRQFGSTMHHNGMSVFLATVPEGVLFHHGNRQRESPSKPDWLAYEIEHAELFASGNMAPPSPRKDLPESEQKPMTNQLHQDQEADDERAGWLHVYRTNRPLQYLYIDGMGGGKTTMGTLDTQDLLLRGNRSISRSSKEQEAGMFGSGPMDERQRAEDLCKLCKEWKLQGVIRMEAGFEIIQCDFSDGLDQIQAHRRGLLRRHLEYEYLRGVAERYDGIGSSRTSIDYSSMVSAFFFPVNLTNPDRQRPDLPRLLETSSQELTDIKSLLEKVVGQRRGKTPSSINWQGVSDMIVSRYASRLEYMAKKVDGLDELAAELSFLLDVHIDYPPGASPSIPEAVDRCTDYYLRPASSTLTADHLVYNAFRVVTGTICRTLFKVRHEVLAVDGGNASSALSKAKAELQSLVGFLDWARFKRCSGCSSDEVCVIPMWPFGSEEDFFHPRCGKSWYTHGKNYWGREKFHGVQN